jgi:hypothetical protein
VTVLQLHAADLPLSSEHIRPLLDVLQCGMWEFTLLEIKGGHPFTDLEQVVQ